MSTNNADTHRLERGGHSGRVFQIAQLFSNIEASGKSRQQNGNNTYSTTYNLYWNADTTMLPPLRQDRSQASLDVALACLRKYAACAQTQKTGTDSATIGAHLAVILNTITQTEHGSLPPKEMNEHIENLRWQINRSQSVSINRPCSRQRVAQFFRAESKMLSVISGHWQISLTTKTVKSSCVNSQADIQIRSALHVRRLRSGEGTYITRFFNEESSIEKYMSLPPVIFTYRQISNADRIFELVANDNVRSLNELLRAGEACLRDCDEDGRSLLFVSTNDSLGY
ncbi:hypothetical protein MBLNU13_g02893t1 [Cladosporium sp. NU13]